MFEKLISYLVNLLPVVKKEKQQLEKKIAYMDDEYRKLYSREQKLTRELEEQCISLNAILGSEA